PIPAASGLGFSRSPARRVFPMKKNFTAVLAAIGFGAMLFSCGHDRTQPRIDTPSANTQKNHYTLTPAPTTAAGSPSGTPPPANLEEFGHWAHQFLAQLPTDRTEGSGSFDPHYMAPDIADAGPGLGHIAQTIHEH